MSFLISFHPVHKNKIYRSCPDVARNVWNDKNAHLSYLSVAELNKLRQHFGEWNSTVTPPVTESCILSSTLSSVTTPCSVTSNFLFTSYLIRTKFEILPLVHHINILQVLFCCQICSVVKRKTAICHSLSRCPLKFVTDRTRGGDRT